MSVQAALASEVVRFYLILAAALLLAAGAVLAGLRWGLGKPVEHAWHAYLSWLLIVPLLALAIVLGRATTITFFTLLAILGLKEFARATGLYADWIMTGAVYL